MLIIKNIILLFGFHVIIFYCHAALPASTNHVFFWPVNFFSELRNFPVFILFFIHVSIEEEDILFMFLTITLYTTCYRKKTEK